MRIENADNMKWYVLNIIRIFLQVAFSTVEKLLAVVVLLPLWCRMRISWDAMLLAAQAVGIDAFI